MPTYGLGKLPPMDDRQALVVFVHGLNSRPEDMQSLVQSTIRSGLACTTFRYPNDQAIEASARLMAREFRRLGTEFPGPLFLVTHSMGGLVARAAIENPQLDPGNVRRLVMIAPPNKGSNLARYACSLDVVEYLTSRARRQEAGLLAGGISDGLSQAVQDLEPGSEFLRRLNQRRRNPAVKYSVILGTAAPLTGSELRWVEKALESSQESCSWMRCAQRQYQDHVVANEEVFSGKGDGFVSIQRGRLAGVQDVVLGHFSHVGVLDDDVDTEVDRVRNEILSRLAP